ncbi:hypothetical protein CC78DRAFT_576937 [Lojkania enalia]|uniref:Uncharacterized protein n=1 Tax=Lojkania enalia TaxID=147567 RepID=A0A9P4N908_9PLEO|nr:hypothetical protein CC78DRAFT_576937 [Didymosphaeria enalia]
MSSKALSPVPKLPAPSVAEEAMPENEDFKYNALLVLCYERGLISGGNNQKKHDGENVSTSKERNFSDEETESEIVGQRREKEEEGDWMRGQ